MLDLVQSKDDSGPTWSLPSALYRDPAQFQLEREKIFSQEWLLFAYREQLEKPGSYVAATAAGYPLIVLRDRDGRLQAYHNACRHRGSRLVADGEGQFGKRIICPYHAWAYNLDGGLNKPVSSSGYGDSLNCDALGLMPVSVDEWRGFVFVRIATEGQTLAEWLGPVVERATAYPLEKQHFFTKKVRDAPVDWKAYGDNYLECYHCRMLHPALCASMDVDGIQVEVDDWRMESFAPARNSNGTQGLFFFRFPFLMLNLYEWGSSIATLEPLGPGHIRHTNWYFFADVSPEKEEENRASVEWSATIVEEDLGILLGVQENLNAGAFDRGPLSPTQEVAVVAFQKMVERALARDAK